MQYRADFATCIAIVFARTAYRVSCTYEPFEEEVPVGLEEVPGDVCSNRIVADAGDDAQHVLLTYAVLILSQRPLQVPGQHSNGKSSERRVKLSYYA